MKPRVSQRRGAADSAAAQTQLGAGAQPVSQPAANPSPLPVGDSRSSARCRCTPPVLATSRLVHLKSTGPDQELLYWISVSVQELDLAPIQLANTGFDFFAVTHHHPNQVVGVNEFFR